MKISFILAHSLKLIVDTELPCLPPVGSIIKLIVKGHLRTYKVNSEPVFLFNKENQLLDIMVSLAPC
jgi:hypothetical protein